MQEAIAYFEQILQMLPEDRATLEFLCIAYKQTGDQAKYLRTLVTLAKVLIGERDVDAAGKLLESFQNHDEPEVKALELKIRAMMSPEAAEPRGAAASKEVASGGAMLPDDKLVAIEAEVALMRWLESNRIVEKSLSEKVCGQLRSFGGTSGEFLISALSVLESENSVLTETAVACIADESHVPPIALESFVQQEGGFPQIPESLVRVRGVVPFGSIAGELLVALANPMDEDLKMKVVSLVGMRCHFYLVPPQSLALVLGRLFPEGSK